MPMPTPLTRPPLLPRRLAAALVTSVLVLLPAAPAAALDDEVVGGPDLAAKGVVVAPGAPPLPDIGAAAWIVADLDTGEVLAAKDPHGQYAPASALKALTAVTLIPELDHARVVGASFDDINIEGSKVGLVERVGYPVSELFSALLMVSGNDAANVLASTAGGQERTATLMNAKAEALGALDTTAVNPHGLDAEGQVSSAYDLALIGRAGLADERFRTYASTLSSSVSAPGGRIAIRNKNKMLQDYPGTLGGKNGFTSRARASYVGGAERDGRRLVVALLKSVPKVFDEAAKLLDWGFAARGITPVGTLVVPAGSEPPVQSPVPTEEVTEAGEQANETAAGSGSPEGTGLPVTLAGMGLAAAALLVVRPGRRLAPAGRPGGTRAPDRRPHAQRPAPRRPAAQRSPARPAPARRR